MSDTSDFLHCDLPVVGKRVHRLGLSCNYGIDEAAFESAMDRGMNYVFWTWLRTGHLVDPMRRALAKDREKMVVATGASLAFFAGSVRRGCESILRKLKTDYIDVFQLFWLGKTSAYTPGTIDALLKLREEKKIRAIGISIHDRPRAGRLVEDSIIDLFMLRYNAAHPGAERDVFPQLAAHPKSIVAYTATSWRKLLKAPRGYDGKVMTAGDCYRFCLSNENVDVVLTGPKNQAELDQNLSALDRGPLTEEESEWMRSFGTAVHG